SISERWALNASRFVLIRRPMIADLHADDLTTHRYLRTRHMPDLAVCSVPRSPCHGRSLFVCSRTPPLDPQNCVSAHFCKHLSAKCTNSKRGRARYAAPLESERCVVGYADAGTSQSMSTCCTGARSTSGSANSPA